MKIDEQFDKLADIYEDDIRQRVPQYDELRKVLFSLMPFVGVAEISVLDLGIGTGGTARELLERYPAARLVGVDVSSKMLEHSRLNLGKFASRTELLQSDFRSLTPTDKFDLVYSILAIHHLPPEDKETLFRKIWNILQFKGVFILIDVVTGTNDQLTERYETLSFPFGEEDDPSSLMEHIEWLQKAGFETIDVPWKHYKLACIIAFKT
ncbi:MAG: class I SAM-dependent methyltransferase [Candidatus Bathyarchaeota archaeon]|nr:class I SAM-dependent methyltransferase [Candidatus Bathyarchaeota archaeon]